MSSLIPLHMLPWASLHPPEPDSSVNDSSELAVYCIAFSQGFIESQHVRYACPPCVYPDTVVCSQSEPPRCICTIFDGSMGVGFSKIYCVTMYFTVAWHPWWYIMSDGCTCTVVVCSYPSLVHCRGGMSGVYLVIYWKAGALLFHLVSLLRYCRYSTLPVQ